MGTCLCDAFFDDVARASYEVLEYLGCEIDFPADQTCCGQPAFNAGDWKASRKVVRHNMEVFAGEDPIVVPSGSCAAMGFHGALLEFEKEADLPQVEAYAARTWELVDYIVNGLGVSTWEGSFPHTVAFHSSCHLRGSKSPEAIRMLLGSIEGLEFMPVGEGEQCCGFGGTFAVSYPNISAAMGELKIEHLTASKPDYVVAADMGCLIHIGGMMDREGMPQKRLHVAQVLHRALVNAGKIQS
jgi:L-lactate dehydrogenase complex protein LldE